MCWKPALYIFKTTLSENFLLDYGLVLFYAHNKYNKYTGSDTLTFAGLKVCILKKFTSTDVCYLSVYKK